MGFTDRVRACGEFVRLLWLQAKQRVMAQQVQRRMLQSEAARQRQIATAKAYDDVRAEAARRDAGPGAAE